MSSRDNDDLQSFSGPQKAAILMLSLGEELTSKLFSMMHEEEIRDISSAMAKLGSVPAVVVERLYQDFAAQMSASNGLIGSYDSTEHLLLKTLPKERVAILMEELRGPAGHTMWDKLGNVNETVLANYLKNEYPQTVAVVLTKIRPDHAARVLARLPESFAMGVVMRMLSMESVQKEVLESVEKTLRAEFMTNLARTQRRDTHEMMAEIFNNLDRANKARFVADLEELSRDAAERIKNLMFTFDHLIRVDGAGIQVLLRSVPKGKLPVALKGANQNIKDLFFKNLSERAGKMLREEMEGLGPVKLKDVDEAQSVIVATAKDLAASGEIRISDGKADEMVG
jgi:flagellar motor switch protein FliG